MTISITANPNLVRVSFAGHVIAESIRTLNVVEDGVAQDGVVEDGVVEDGRAAVIYFPRADVDLELCAPNEHVSHCPYKGVARHFDIVIHDRKSENALWCYETPPAAAAAIAGYVAFDAGRVDSITQFAQNLRGGSLA